MKSSRFTESRPKILRLEMVVIREILFESQIPLLVAVFVVTNMISRTRWFQQTLQNLVDPRRKPISSNVDKIVGSRNFERLGDSSKEEVLCAIKQLIEYSENTKKANDRRRKLFKMMTWRQQRLCEDTGYLKRLGRIDSCVETNLHLTNSIAKVAMEHYGLSYGTLNGFKNNANNASSNNYRVLEALGHFARDWCKQGEEEIEPLLKFVKNQLNAIIPASERSNTTVVVPGSGLGRVAHEIALMGSDSNQTFKKVHAVEYSGLMHACNNFIYSQGDRQQFDFYPYVHTNSNYIDTSSQLRPLQLRRGVTKPENLSIHHEDFHFFNIEEKEHVDNVVVVTIFFIDTAENLMEYLDTIKTLVSPGSRNLVKNGYWINAGPLKYGTAAQAELNAQELELVRKKTGWVDLFSANSLDIQHGEYGGLYGYITDKKSLWQGYYGLSMWTSRRKENKNKV